MMKLLNINLENANDYNRAIRLLQSANVELGVECRERDLTVATIEVDYVYEYTCPHCWADYTEMGDELKTHYDAETGLIQCKCGRDLHPFLKYNETVLPQVMKAQEEEQEIRRIVIDIDEYERVHELLRLAGIEAYDLGFIDQVVVYLNHAYRFDCPNCEKHYDYLAYEHEEFYVDYNLEEKQIHCKCCDQTFKAVFKPNENMVIE